MRKIGSRYRYREGLVIAEWNTHSDEIFPEDDHVIKRLFVKAGPGDATKEGAEVDLVGYMEVEVVSIEDGEDKGFFEPPIEVYRTPFPYDVRVRKHVLRQMAEQPKFYVY